MCDLLSFHLIWVEEVKAIVSQPFKGCGSPFTKQEVKLLVSCYQTTTGPIAERSKSSDLDCGRGDLGSNPGEGRNFFYFLSRW